MQTSLFRLRSSRVGARCAPTGAALALMVALALGACSRGDRLLPAFQGADTMADSMGGAAEIVRTIASQARKAITEGSAVVASTIQPGVLFLINDSGHDETLFALDSTGNDRGSWRVRGARNVDWESLSSGPCPGAPRAASAIESGDGAAAAPESACLYIGDTGDNARRRPFRTIYRVPEPRALAGTGESTLTAERLDYRYPDQPHDVEAMYVARDGTTYLITKRPLRREYGSLRPALVFSLPGNAWGSRDTVVATLRDSLPIVPGSAPLRTITDAALSPDGRLLAVRTYVQVYSFATDSLTGLVRHDLPVAPCNVSPLGEETGEGVSWLPGTTLLLLTSEGRRSPLHVVRCPLPTLP